MDFIKNGQAHGSVAQKLLAAHGDPRALRPYMDDGKAFVTMKHNGELIAVPTTNATLRKDEWKHYDQAVLKVAQDRLVGVADLNAAGLTYSPGGGLGSTVLEYEDMSDIEDAVLSMDGLNRGNNDRPEYDMNYLPLPITHKDFQINTRVLQASRTTGNALDTTMAELSARKVVDKLETILFQGASAYAFGGGIVRGYADHPSRNTVSLGTNWDASAATGTSIVDQVREMKQALIADGFFGPYMLYIPTAYETVLDDDFKAASDKTIRQRILEIASISGVKVADKLTANNVIMVQMTSDVVRMVNAVPITTVQWDVEGGMAVHFKVLTVQVPQIRADQNGNCGVCHMS